MTAAIRCTIDGEHKPSGVVIAAFISSPLSLRHRREFLLEIYLTFFFYIKIFGNILEIFGNVMTRYAWRVETIQIPADVDWYEEINCENQ